MKRRKMKLTRTMADVGSSYEFEAHGNHKLVTLNNMLIDVLNLDTVAHSGTISVHSTNGDVTDKVKLICGMFGDVHVYKVTQLSKEERENGISITVVMFHSAMGL